MAIKALAIAPAPAVDNSFNFGPLAKLGQASPQNDALANLGQRYGTPSAVASSPAATGDAIGNELASISGIESSGRYNLKGPVTNSGDQAYGKYQIMGANVPEWTRAALGTAMTPDQFLANPDAQEATARHRWSYYRDKYGPDGAARAWLAGEGGMNNPNAKDQLGTSVAEYSRRFNAGLGGQNGY